LEAFNYIIGINYLNLLENCLFYTCFLYKQKKNELKKRKNLLFARGLLLFDIHYGLTAMALSAPLNPGLGIFMSRAGIDINASFFLMSQYIDPKEKKVFQVILIN
jgi:hypothetical protein